MIAHASNPQESSVADLVVASQKGDREAYGELVMLHIATCLRVAERRLHNPLDAEEICQEAFVKGWTKIHQCEPTRFSGWILRIVSREICDHLERLMTQARDPRRVKNYKLETIPDQEDQAESIYLEAKRSQVRDVLGTLREKDQKVLSARFWENLSYAEMGVRFNLAPGTVKWRLHTAKQRFKAAYTEKLS